MFCYRCTVLYYQLLSGGKTSFASRTSYNILESECVESCVRCLSRACWTHMFAKDSQQTYLMIFIHFFSSSCFFYFSLSTTKMNDMNYSNDESTPLKGYIEVEENPKGLCDTTTAQKQHKRDLRLMLMGMVIGVLGVLGVAVLSNTTTSSTSIGLKKLKMEILDFDEESSPSDFKSPSPTYCTEDQEKGKLICDGPGEEKCAALYTSSSALCVAQPVCKPGEHPVAPVSNTFLSIYFYSRFLM